MAQLTVLDQYEMLQKDIEKLKASRSAVFFTECKIAQGEKAIMILPAKSAKGEFFDLVDTTTIDNEVIKNPVNWADMSLKNGKWSYDIALGGEATLKFQAEVIEFLLKSNFKILKPAELGQILKSEPRLRCRYS